MRPYEGMFLLDSSGTPAELEESITSLTELLTKRDAEIVLARKWGERRLLYEIGKHKKAHYQLIFFRMDPDRIIDLRRELELAENVIRHFFLTHREDRFETLVEESSKKEEEARTREAESAASAAAAAAASSEGTPDEASSAESSDEKAPGSDDSKDEGESKPEASSPEPESTEESAEKTVAAKGEDD